MRELHEVIKQAMVAQGKVDPEAVLALAQEIDLDDVPAAPDLASDPGPDPELVELAPAGELQPELDYLGPDSFVVELRGPIRWEEFFTEAEVEATKRVRRGQQQLGPLARKWIADVVGGTIGDGDRSAKQFVNTSRGRYRISLSIDGDNTTETAAHERMGVETIAVEDMEAMCAFFTAHELAGVETYEALREHLRARLRDS
jgi:hypothetical protein